MDNESLLKKWLNNELSTEEQTVFEQSEDFAINQSIIKEAQRFKAENFVENISYEQIQNRIKAKPKEEKSTAFNPKWYTYVSGIAAAVLLLFGVYTFLSTSTTNFDTQIAETEIITLPDNSVVKLNAVSQLSYDKKNWKNNRAINLNGEAFFDVEKGSKFEVISSDGVVSVLGTEFNVKQREHSFEVTCFEGKVQVQTNEKTVILLPGNGIIYRGGQLLKIKTTLTNPTWINGMSTFNKTPILAVFNEVERQFNVKVAVKDLDQKLEFSGGFSNNNLQEALKAITLPIGVKFKISKDQKQVVVFTADLK